MRQQVLVVFNKTGKELTSTTHLKRYQYNIDCPEVHPGDQLVTLEHDNAMQVVGVLGCWASTPGVNKVEVIRVNGIDVNGYGSTSSYMKSGSKNSNNLNNSNKDKKMGNMKKSMFNTIIDKYKAQFMPVKRLGVRVSMDGNICVPSGDEYVSISKDNQLTSYPEAMTMDVPVYTINKTIDKIEVGDVIADVDGAFMKVVVKDNGTLKVLSYTGTSEVKSVANDFITKQTFVPVVVNMFAGLGDESQMNPMMLMMMSGEDLDMKDMLMMQMMSGQKMDQMNPMMLMMLSDKGDNNMMEMMLMMQMMGGQNPFTIKNEE